MSPISSLSGKTSPEDAILRLSSAITELVPAATILPARESGHEVQVPLVVGAGAVWVVEGLRERLERPAVAALGATLMRVWPPARVGDETWFVVVRRERAGLLADALDRQVVYPLTLCGLSRHQLQVVAPEVAETPEIEVAATTERTVGRNLPPIYTAFVTSDDLDAIERGLAERERQMAPNSFWSSDDPSAFGSATEMLAEAVRQARLHPLERAA